MAWFKKRDIIIVILTVVSSSLAVRGIENYTPFLFANLRGGKLNKGVRQK